MGNPRNYHSKRKCGFENSSKTCRGQKTKAMFQKRRSLLLLEVFLIHLSCKEIIAKPQDLPSGFQNAEIPSGFENSICPLNHSCVERERCSCSSDIDSIDPDEVNETSEDDEYPEIKIRNDNVLCLEKFQTESCSEDGSKVRDIFFYNTESCNVMEAFHCWFSSVWGIGCVMFWSYNGHS